MSLTLDFEGFSGELGSRWEMVQVYRELGCIYRAVVVFLVSLEMLLEILEIRRGALGLSTRIQFGDGWANKKQP